MEIPVPVKGQQPGRNGMGIHPVAERAFNSGITALDIQIGFSYHAGGYVSQ